MGSAHCRPRLRRTSQVARVLLGDLGARELEVSRGSLDQTFLEITEQAEQAAAATEDVR